MLCVSDCRARPPHSLLCVSAFEKKSQLVHNHGFETRGASLPHPTVITPTRFVPVVPAPLLDTHSVRRCSRCAERGRHGRAQHHCFVQKLLACGYLSEEDARALYAELAQQTHGAAQLSRHTAA
jgi:hypothetical protein